jgi:hypothetical protein
MSIKLQILIIVVIILAMLYIVNHVRKKSIDFKYALLWLFVCLCVLVLAIFPKLLNVVAKAFGIASPVNMLFFFGFCIKMIYQFRYRFRPEFAIHNIIFLNSCIIMYYSRCCRFLMYSVTHKGFIYINKFSF